MAHLTYFETSEEYNSYVSGEDFVYPNISYCEDDGSLYYNQDRISITATYETFESEFETTLFNNPSSIKYIVIDGNRIDIDAAESPYKYTFEETGEHVVYISFKGNSKIVPKGLFSGNTFLKKLKLVSSIIDIEEDAIAGCVNLVEANIPLSVKYIRGHNFSYCPRLQLNEPILNCQIGESCFYYFNTVNDSIVINGNVGNNSFYYITGLTSVTINGNISNSVMTNCGTLEHITINGDVNGSGVCNYCDNLKTLTLNGNINVAYGISSYWNNLKEIVINGNINNGGNFTSSMSSLSAVTINGNLKDGNFTNSFQSLKSISISGNIGNGNFNSNLPALTSLSISGYVGDNNFTYPYNNVLTELYVGGSIGNGNFNNFTGLTSYVVTKSIGNNNFYSCNGLTGVTFSGTQIGNIGSSFNSCNSLSSVTVDSNCSFSSATGGNYGGFSSCPIKELTFTSNVSRIYPYFMYGKNNLSSVTISEGVTTIGDNAFDGCSNLSAITIPASVTSIGSLAFNYGPSGRQITFAATNTAPDVESDTFRSNSNISFLIHCSAKIPFDQNTTWDTYRSNISIIESECTESERWVSAGNICDNNQIKTLENKELSTDNETWYPTDVYRTGTTSLGSCPYSNVDLNSQWSASTKPAPSGGYSVYESYSNVGVNNSQAEMKIVIFGYETFTFKVRNYSEGGYDFVVVLNLDDETTRSSWTTTLTAGTGTYSRGYVYYTNKGKSSSTTWYDVTFDNLDRKEHTIRVIYGKDGSSSDYDDKGYVAISN